MLFFQSTHFYMYELQKWIWKGLAGEKGGRSKLEITNGGTSSNYDDITATTVTFVLLCCTLFLLEVKRIAPHGPAAIKSYK